MNAEALALLDHAAADLAQARKILMADGPATSPAPVILAPAASGFELGGKSIRELEGVHPRPVEVVRRAITLSAQDFTVHDGLRTADEQRALVAGGASQTMDSNHLKQPDGFGHAVDLVPWIGGKPRWEWEAIYPIAAAMRLAAAELTVDLTWGGCWDLPLAQIAATPGAMADAVAGYVARRKAAGKNAFIDGPHYELRAA